MFKSGHPTVLAFLVRAVYGFVGEIVSVNETWVEALEVSDDCVEVYSGLRGEGEGSLNRPLGFNPPQLLGGRDENIVSSEMVMEDGFDPGAHLAAGVSHRYREIDNPRKHEG